MSHGHVLVALHCQPNKRSKAMEGASSRDLAALQTPVPEGEAAKEAVLTDTDLLVKIFERLALEDLCRAAMVRHKWRELADSPCFWERICLKGRTLMVGKVIQLLRKHNRVKELNARGVRFCPHELVDLLPCLRDLQSLELDKASYENVELDEISGTLPQLTRLVLAGGVVGSTMHVAMHAPGGGGGAAALQHPQQRWACLHHPRLASLCLEGGRAPRLRVACPQLTSLELRDFNCSSLQLTEASVLQTVRVHDCGTLSDASLRYLLCLEGDHGAGLPALTQLEVCSVAHVSDDTVRLAGLRLPALSSLLLSGCPALTGDRMVQHQGFGALRSLAIESCDSVTGTKLSESVRDLHALEALTIAGGAQLSTLSLRSHSLRSLRLRGTRSLTELDLRCTHVEEVVIEPLSPGLAAAAGLRRISLASHAVQRLAWAGFPALRDVVLQCPSLQELDLSECGQLRDTVFESLGAGPEGWLGGYLGSSDQLVPACPRLRLLKLGECNGLRAARLASTSLECLQMSQCQGIVHVELDCPALTSLALEECRALEDASLRSARMGAMSLGTCPRLTAIAIDSPSIASLDLRGCNELARLALACPALRRIDATFCGSLSNAAVMAMAACPALEELVLAVCHSLTAEGLAALAPLQRLVKLDLSYSAMEDPSAIYPACRHLTSLILSSNYRLLPEPLLALFPPPPAQPPLPCLQELDASYCSAPTEALAELILRGGRQLHCLLINGCREGVRDALWPRLHTGCLPPAALASLVSPPHILQQQQQQQQLWSLQQQAVAGEQHALQGQAQGHGLRVLSMVGSKQLRRFCLGLAPEAEAQRCGLLEPGTAAVAGVEVQGVRYVPLATELEGLQELRLSLSALQSLVVGLPRLRDLQLNNCSELCHLLLACPALTRLSLQSCRLGLEALLAVVARCPSLLELDLQYCPPQLSSPGVVQALQQACPSLQAVLVTPPAMVS